MELEVAQRKISFEVIDAEFLGTVFHICFCKDKEDSVSVKYENDSSCYHSHGYYELHYVLQGTVSFVFEKENIRVEKDNFLLVPPQLEHMRFMENKETVCCVIGIESEQNGGENGSFSYFQTTLAQFSKRPIAGSENLKNDFVRFFEISERTDLRSYCFSKRLIYDILTDLFDLFNHFSCNSVLPNEQENSREIEMLLGEYVNGNISVNDIADRLHYSPRHIARMISDIYGMPLGELQKKRMAESAKKYMENRMPLEEILAKTGFENETALRRAFKKYIGMTVTEYKKNNE